jgi:hypothetical protein
LADNLNLIDTIADPLNSFTVLETADLVLRIKAVIINLDRLYPDRSYYQFWLGKVNEQTQAEIATGLGLTQSAISKRRLSRSIYDLVLSIGDAAAGESFTKCLWKRIDIPSIAAIRALGLDIAPVKTYR